MRRRMIAAFAVPAGAAHARAVLHSAVALMKIAVVGTGYVGLVVGVGFAENGNSVVCVDSDAAKIALLKRGEVPIYEPGLEELLARNAAEERLSFSTDLPEAV